MLTTFVATGIWVAGAQCLPLSATFTLVLSLSSAAISTDGHAFLKLPASNNKLPVPGTDYSILMSASSTGVKIIQQSNDFAIASPTMTLTFRIITKEFVATRSR